MQRPHSTAARFMRVDSMHAVLQAFKCPDLRQTPTRASNMVTSRAHAGSAAWACFELKPTELGLVLVLLASQTLVALKSGDGTALGQVRSMYRRRSCLPYVWSRVTVTRCEC